jgi:hypothetical protein
MEPSIRTDFNELLTPMLGTALGRRHVFGTVLFS